MSRTAAMGPSGSARSASGRATVWAVAITGAAQFMAALDNLVVTMALPRIIRPDSREALPKGA